MKKRFFFVGLALMGWLGTAQAQVANVNPVPQEVTSQSATLCDLPKTWHVVCSDELKGSAALNALATAAVQADEQSKFVVKLGVRGDKTVKKYAKHIPTVAEGYYLEITEKGIVIAAADKQGLFYGVQTLLGIAREGKLELCTVKDWPDVPFRGVVEGFYGTPWSHEARLSQLDFYGRNKMNVYIYGPKDDPWHRDYWRDPYPEVEGARIQELAEHAKACGVNFYWAIHPGVDIKWTIEDRDKLVAKFEKMYELGVRSFAVFFDDIWGEGAKADKQAELLNYVDDNFVKMKPDVAPLVMCPTEYNRAWANDEKGYLRTLGTKMNKGIEIMWTGNAVVHCIDKESMEWVNQRIDRKAYIWWNFPVSDFVRDRILLGPTYGNGLDIAEDLAGFVSNPMEHAEASKIALYGVADYTWNMEAYDYQKDWEKAIQDLLPSNADALRTFALYNKDLGPNGHGFRREEGDELLRLAAAVKEGGMRSVGRVMRKCNELKLAADLLLADKTNPRLIKELTPWLLQARLVADYGISVCNLSYAAAPQKENRRVANFDLLYKQARSIQQQMYNLGNSSVRHAHQPDIKLAGKVMLPMLNDLFARSVKAYNAANGTAYEPVSEYLPYQLTSTVPQLAQQPIVGSGNEVKINPSNEVITWAPGTELLISMEQAVKLQGLDFDFGVADQAKNFKLEVMVGGVWKPVSLLHYREGETTVHTGNEIAGMAAEKIRLTNTSGAELKVYFRSFRFSKQ